MIDRFRGEYAFLSNFHPSSITVNTIHYPTVEHAFQAAKITTDLDPEDRYERQLAIANMPSAGYAKRAGRRLVLRADWKNVRLGVMWRCLTLKFKDPELRDLLVRTRPHELVESNEWGDTFWGVCRGTGTNHLGKLLMVVRD